MYFSFPSKRNFFVAHWVLRLYSSVCINIASLCLCKKESVRGGGELKPLSLIFCSSGVFLIGLGIENLSVSQVILYAVLFVEVWFSYRKSVVWALFPFVSSLLSAVACIFNPAGKRLQYEISVNKNASELGTLVKQNVCNTLRMLLQENAWIFLFLAGVILTLFCQQQGQKKRYIWFQVCRASITVGGIILLITALPMHWLIVGTNGQVTVFQMIYHSQLVLQNFVFSNHISAMIFWLYWMAQLAFSGLFFFSKKDAVSKISLILFAICSIVVVWILPYMPRRTHFFALSVIVSYTVALARRIRFSFYSKKIWKVAAFLVCVIQVESYMMLLIPVKRITEEREKIFEEYHLRTAMGETINQITIPAYPADSISFEDAQINPSPEVNEYAYNAMKDYYHLPRQLRVVVETQD